MLQTLQVSLELPIGPKRQACICGWLGVLLLSKSWLKFFFGNVSRHSSCITYLLLPGDSLSGRTAKRVDLPRTAKVHLPYSILHCPL